MPRPFLSHSIDQLEALFASHRRSDASVLEQLSEELAQRTTRRAKRLREEVKRELQSSIVPATSTIPSPLPSPLPSPSPSPSLPSPRLPPPPPAPATGDRAPLQAPPSEKLDAPDTARLLETWTALEVLSPQGFRRPEDLVAGDRARIAHLNDGALPWQSGGGGRLNKRLYYQVVLGELQLEPAYAALLVRYADQAPDRPGSNPLGLLAAVVCDKSGVPEPDRIAFSSFGWALPIALSGDLGRLQDWRKEEQRLKAELGSRLRRTDQDGNPLPLDRAWLDDVHGWLTTRLGLTPELVKPPSFAVREYQPLFIRDAPSPLLLNSFFLGDLGRARDLVLAGKAPPTLRRYLAGIAPDATRDVLRDPGLLAELLEPRRTPPGRWPGRGRRSLISHQQAAVNAAASARPGDIVAVNGPPGTGKTTLLRDIVAAVITARAEVLASFDHPERAFTCTGVRFTQAQATVELRAVASQLRGFEMVVASSNNRAVENVSAELPGMGAIAEDVPELRYFSSVATALRGEECWGLAAAVLGNASNIYKFQETFWKDEDRGLESYLATAAGTPRVLVDADGTARPPTVVVQENPPSGPAEALARWQSARKRFAAALRSTKSIQEERQRLHELEGQIPRHRALIEDLEAQWTEAVDASRSIEGERQAAISVSDACAKSREGAESAHALHLAARPGFFARIFRTEAARSWQAQNEALRRQSREAATAEKDAAEARGACEARLREAGARVAGLAEQISRESDLLAKEEAHLNGALSSLGAPTGLQVATAPHSERHQATAWFDSAAQRARDDVFVAAIQLHKAFVDAAAQPLRHNLAALVRHLWTGVPRATPQHVRDLWASFALVVPLFSSTFASVEKMFGDLGPSSFGWLLLDESGQATPQASVGAILRADRVIVVGDPLQVEPVVTLPQSLTHSICQRFGVSPSDSAAPSASTQTFADRASPTVGSFETCNGTRRVGIPLLVHRRCAEPMFGISNAIAYENLMVKATPPRESPIGKVLGDSRWLHCAGTATSHWSPEEGNLLLQLLRALARARVAPDLYVISPFRAVAQEARRLIQRDPDLGGFLGDAERFAKERIGTIHTVQGREAEAVIFVLGAPEARQQGARLWAGSTPNLLNVAVTRAQERLYVIGNRELWRTAGCFRKLDERIS